MKNALLCAAMVIVGWGLALGQAQYRVLYNFGSYPNDGVFAGSTPVLDKAGNIYGTTMQGGTEGNGGTVFELSSSGGTWSETILYSFCSQYVVCPSGSDPAGLVLDLAGNIYGMTSYGGQQPCPAIGSTEGCGVVFELSPPAVLGGAWTYTVLYSFCSVGEFCSDGANPFGALTFDKSGNLYGTTEDGGDNDAGTVFELSQSPSGWTETVLYSFCPEGGNLCPDGSGPAWGVTFDRSSGKLYGTTAGGGGISYAGGVLYELSPVPGGWTEAVLYKFTPPKPNWRNSPGPVSIDPIGNLYDTFTTYRGDYSNGTVGRLNTKGDVNLFRFNGADGRGPLTGVLIDTSRHVLYGTTATSVFGPGNIFRIDKFDQETVLYTFCQQLSCTDGYLPGGLAEDNLGNLYGTTVYGGNQGGNGVVFEITP